MPSDHQPDRFATAAEYYTGGRPDYPPRLIRRVAERFALTRHARVLDLGTGPGLLALGFAPYVAETIGIDPSADMLAQAQANARQAGLAGKITFLPGAAPDLPAGIGAFDLVVIGRAFHWMDRAATLRALEAHVRAAGGIALFWEDYPDLPQNAWHAEFRRLITQYSGRVPNGGSTRKPMRHDEVLLASVFSNVERITVLERRATPLLQFARRALSFSSVWNGLPGSRNEDLAPAVLEALAPFAVDGVIHEIVEGIAVLATRE